MSDIFLDKKNLQISFQSIRVSNKTGIKAAIVENINRILNSGQNIDENTLKKINIFRLQQYEFNEIQDRFQANFLQPILDNKKSQTNVNNGNLKQIFINIKSDPKHC